MISKAADVDAYIAELPADRRATIEKLRALCRRHLAGYEEGMDYGMPVYKRNGTMEISFASQKQYVAIYVLKKDVLDEFRVRLAGAKIGKGCVRFTKPERIDYEVLRELFQRNASSPAAPC
jgi:uncharacterized protein YdhG (YjbR/CyaY superfamily)